MSVTEIERLDRDSPVEPAATSELSSRHAVDIVVPVHNEQHGLATSVRRLHAYLSTQLTVGWRITIVDNASVDGTWLEARRLAHELSDVVALHLEEKGRGRALHHAWAHSDAEVLVYMDVDLSTDLAALPPLVAPLLSGHSDVAIGSRLARGARVVRGPKREVVSRCYNAILRTMLRARFSDAQCGFKAIRRDRAQQLLPLVKDQGWFFDTELLVLAERSGMRIHEVPVDWVDDPDSRVAIVATALADLRGVARLMHGLATRRIPVADLRVEPGGEGNDRTLGQQAFRFVCIGVLSTVAYLVAYLVLRVTMTALAANAVSLLLTAILNTAANRRLTFGITERPGRWRQQAQGLVVFGIALAITSSSLGLLHAVASDPRRWAEAIVLVIANLVATAVRFVLLRRWVFATTQD